MPTPLHTFPPAFPIAGVDEVGRGPLAGPVVAAAVVLDPRRPVDGLDDSKRLDEAERERLDALIRRRALAWCVASASVAEIDELNILHASLLAMSRAVGGLVAPDMGGATRPWPPGSRPAAGRVFHATIDRLADPLEGRPGGPEATPALVLVDGNRCPPLPYPACAVVGGDARVRSIAAASIVAKVARDALMTRWHEHHPGFGFASHKGYATKVHRDALARYGALPLHRRSFAPVKAAIEQAAIAPIAAGPFTPEPVAPGSERPSFRHEPQSRTDP